MKIRRLGVRMARDKPADLTPEERAHAAAHVGFRMCCVGAHGGPLCRDRATLVVTALGGFQWFACSQEHATSIFETVVRVEDLIDWYALNVIRPHGERQTG